MKKYIIQVQPELKDQLHQLRFRNEMEKQSFRYIDNKLKSPVTDTAKTELFEAKATTIKEINDAVFRVLYRTGNRYAFTVRREKLN